MVAVPGLGTPYGRSVLSWCKKNGLPAILMSESKWDDKPRSRIKEYIKWKLFISKFDAALVGGENHKQYLVDIGFSKDKIFTGYDVVDNDFFRLGAERARGDIEETRRRQPLIPEKPYFIATTRFLPRKNLLRMVEAYEKYVKSVGDEACLDLVICGSGEQEMQRRELVK